MKWNNTTRAMLTRMACGLGGAIGWFIGVGLVGASIGYRMAVE